MRKRVYLYIVSNSDLLVLRHVDFPELGLQIPGGTVEEYEAPADAAAREAQEETGLTLLGSPKFRGVAVVQSLRSEEKFLEAWFYRIDVVGEVPYLWMHTECHASADVGMVRFELSWISFPEANEQLSEADCLMLEDAIRQG